MNELVSVIIPVYKVEKYLKKCVDSVINQTYKNLEIILVDDGSPDSCPKICDEYAKKDSRIKVIHKENGGLASARNAGLDIAKGDFISFIDSDDWVELNFIEKLLKELQKTDSDLVMCGYNKVLEKDLSVEESVQLEKKIEIREKDIIKSINKSIYTVVAWNKLYKKFIFDKLRYPKQKTGEDVAIFHEILFLSKKVTIIPDLLYNYLQREGSIMLSPYDLSKLKDHQDNFERKMKFFISNDFEELADEEITCFLNNLFPRFIHSKDKLLKKNIKQIYKSVLNNYKNYYNPSKFSLKLKIKILIVRFL